MPLIQFGYLDDIGFELKIATCPGASHFRAEFGGCSLDCTYERFGCLSDLRTCAADANVLFQFGGLSRVQCAEAVPLCDFV